MTATAQYIPIKGYPDLLHCPVCGMVVRIQRRNDGSADHYEAIQDSRDKDNAKLPGVDKYTRAMLAKQRQGKKSVALVGFSPTSVGMAPWDAPSSEIEIWCLNEAHSFPWMKRWDRWIQIHRSQDFMKPIAKRDVQGHYDWLKQEHDHPVYMQNRYDEIPNSTEYPLPKICQRFLKNLWVGQDNTRKYFTSSLAYMVALALYEGFERIEVYGVEMSWTDEWIPQKACMEFWLGMALGMGKSVYLPPNCQLINAPLYGYVGQGPRNEVEEETISETRMGRRRSRRLQA
jgi:hypothetical protein